jgi:hypothetical protein
MKYLLLFCCLCFAFHTSAQSDEIKIKVHTRNHAFFNVPVFIPLDKLPVKNLDSMVLYQVTGQSNKVQPFQIESGPDPGMVFIMQGLTPARAEKEYVLRSGVITGTFPRIEIVSGNEIVTMVTGNKKIVSYQHAEKMPPEGVDPVFRRSAFVHPLWSPGQTVLTRIQPDDHYHHYGIWNPWTRTKFKGEEIDFWNLGEKQGTVRFKGMVSRVEGNVFGEINVLQDHIKTSGGVEETCAA